MDACVENGAKCGQAAADAFCQYLGFDYNAAELYSTTVATAPAISLTGTLLKKWSRHDHLICGVTDCTSTTAQRQL